MGKKDKKKKKKERKKEKVKRAREAMEEEYRTKKRLKAAMKAKETPEERRARRLAKKLKKEEQREAQNKLFDYSNDKNPFRDKNLTKMFIWKKKYEKEIKQGKDPRQLTRDNLRRRQKELASEIEDLKERRRQREQEEIELEQMRDEQERMNALADLEDFEEKEEEFHRRQAKVRSDIRIKAGREKPIDVLAKNLRIYEDDADLDADVDVELAEPYRIFDDMDFEELSDLRKDIMEMIELKESLSYWEALKTVCDDKLENLDAKDGGRNKYGINVSVQNDISKMLDEKSHSQLIELRQEINEKLDAGGAVDVAYWDALLKMLNVFQAKATLNDFHQSILDKRLTQLRNAVIEEGDEDEEDGSSDGKDDGKAALKKQKMVSNSLSEEKELSLGDSKGKAEAARDIVGESLRAAGMARFSTADQELFLKEERKGMGEDEAQFSAEVPVPTEIYSWHDKYRPRKPRYFNRVRTGYDWNKYNQTHYDKENPPPKVVQGYKFNIFYPDLIDPSKAPTYTLHEYAPDPSYAILTFRSGPPYEDIAFKIVNKRMEFGHKRGFKCKFERGVLYLYFNFERIRYRR